MCLPLIVVLSLFPSGVAKRVDVQEHGYWHARRMKYLSQNSVRMIRGEVLMGISERTGLFDYTIVLGCNGMRHDQVLTEEVRIALIRPLPGARSLSAQPLRASVSYR